jgi:glycerate kinase
MGKGVGEIARWCQKFKLPCIGLAGVIHDSALVKKRFAETHKLIEVTTIEQARAKPAYWLEQLAMRVARGWP